MLLVVALLLAFFVLPSPWNVVAVVVAAVAEIGETALYVWWSRRRRPVVGVEALVGRTAVVVRALSPTGQVKLDGEVWEARAACGVELGREVVVTRVDGLVLEVEPVM